jgi:hypothetical protein
MRSGRYQRSVRQGLPDNARAYLDRAFAGDALAARRLMLIAPRRLRGHIAFLAYQSKLANPAYREIVKAVWHQPTRHLLTGFWRPQVVRRMLARADFRVPQFSGPLMVFRPVDGSQEHGAAADLCWSLSPEFALAAAEAAGAEPKILRASIDPADVIYFGNRNGEQEIVCRRPIGDATVIEAAKLGRKGAEIGVVLPADYRPRSHHA